MSKKRYVIGIDYGTLSGRTVLINADTGEEIAVAEECYAHAVMDAALPTGERLPDHFALQHPADYLDVLRRTIPAVLARGGVEACDVVGLGIDFTACTLLPLDRDGTPLCMKAEWEREPQAFVKLWKHHAAQAEADEITALACARGERWIDSYGGKISCEWALPKILEVLRRAPHVFEATDRFSEAADWLSFVLTGKETHAATFAGYKGLWQAETGYPSDEYLRELDERLVGLYGSKICAEVNTAEQIAGTLGAKGAALTGLAEGTPVALPIIDAHAAMPAVGAVKAGNFVMIVGTSACHLLHGNAPKRVEGTCGYVPNAVIPGCTTFEAGQACVGDGFSWFVNNLVPERYEKEAAERGISIHQLLREYASALRPGESGLVVLDWQNGNRSILNNAALSGMILGLTLATRPEEIYRAYLEASAFGSRVIVEQFEKNGLPVGDICAAGGIAQKDPLMMQIYADVLGKRVCVANTKQAGAIGSAIYAAVAGGVYQTVAEAAATLAAPCGRIYEPNEDNRAAYDALYAEYVRLHDFFGKEHADLMPRLRELAKNAKN